MQTSEKQIQICSPTAHLVLLNLSSDQLYEESCSYVVPEDFLWGDVSVINEDELLKAAFAHSLQDQRSTAEEIELQHLT